MRVTYFLSFTFPVGCPIYPSLCVQPQSIAYPKSASTPDIPGVCVTPGNKSSV